MWFYTKDKKSRLGPYTFQQLQQLAATGYLTPSDMVQNPAGAWVAASSIPALFANQQAAPVVYATPTNVPDWMQAGTSTASAPESQQRKAPSVKQKISPVLLYGLLGGGAVMLLSFFLCCGFGIFLNAQKAEAISKEMQEAEQFWAAGKNGEAVAKYKHCVDDGFLHIPRSERPTVLQRVIEFDVEKGDTSSAKRFIEKALDENVALALSNPAAKQLMAEVEQKRAEAKQQQAKREEKKSNGNKGKGNDLVDDSAVSDLVDLSGWTHDGTLLKVIVKAKKTIPPSTRQGPNFYVDFFGKDDLKLHSDLLFIDATMFKGEKSEVTIPLQRDIFKRTVRIKVAIR